VIGAVVVTGQIVTKKGALITEKKEKERDIKIKAEMDKTQKLVDDMRAEARGLEAERQKWEAAHNDQKGNVSGETIPKADRPGEPAPQGKAV
jgi:hypothetical protein